MKTRIAVWFPAAAPICRRFCRRRLPGSCPRGNCLVVSNNPEAYALERAKQAGVPAAVVSKKECGSQAAFEAQLQAILELDGVELLILAGFMSILSESFTRKWPNRILNVHPSLIPAFCGEGFYGLRVHQAALARGSR